MFLEKTLKKDICFVERVKGKTVLNAEQMSIENHILMQNTDTNPITQTEEVVCQKQICCRNCFDSTHA